MDKSHLEFNPIPRTVWKNVPRDFVEVAKHLTRPAERDLWITGAIPVLAGMMPNVLIKYGRHWHNINLFTCVVAPSAAGKGILRVPKRLGEVLHDRLFEESLKRLAEYEARRA